MRIAIIGCGPAGLFAATALHDNQFDVTLFEQFEQPAPVGSGLVLQPTGLAMLEAIGLRSQAESLGQRIDRMSGRLAPAGKVVLDIKYNALQNNLYGVAIHRAALFQLLFDAVTTRNIPIKTNCKVTSVVSDKDRKSHLKIDQHADQHSSDSVFDLVIDASGVNSSVLRSLHPNFTQTDLSFGALWTTVELNGFSPTVLEQRYVKANKMIGILPCGQLPDDNRQLATLFYSIEGKDYQRWLQQGLDVWKSEVTTLWPETAPLLQQIDSPEQITFTTYSHHTLKPPHTEGVVFIGDAAHATSPQLGQGANMAFLDALALTTALKINRNNLPLAGAHYAQLRRSHVRMYQAVSYFLTPFYQSNSRVLPILRDTFFEPVTSIAFMNRFITRLGSGLLGNPAATLVSKYGQSE